LSTLSLPEKTHSQKEKGLSSMSTIVTVASKFPMPFTLRLYVNVKKHDLVMGGGTREYTIAQPVAGEKIYVVDGVSYHQNRGIKHNFESGFALTHNIPRDFWERWLEQNKDADYVVNGMIFANDENASAKSRARELESVKSGLERIDPTKIHEHGLELAKAE
jgi:hypothetical protein